MDKRHIVKNAIINSFCASLYIILIVSLIYLGGQSFFGEEETILIPIAMLMLFVFSAAFTGSLIFGKPIMWYLDGKKREALSLLMITLGIFLTIPIIILLSLIALA